ncbi:phage tailspike protein [Yokenella regensburgei]|uniref:phage tailspike protein n=1 Tax=Yokenella regensburgei TaxID=158877 RepID=UPI0031DD888A
MSSLVTNPTSQFINPLFGNICENASIYIGKPGTDAMAPENRIDVYMVRLTAESTLEKVPLPQPLLTNSAGVICYEGLPITPWVDSAYSISIIGYDRTIIYSAFYVDDPTYWLRLDLATMPQRLPNGLHYDPNDKHGVNMIAGAAPILSPLFEGIPETPTPQSDSPGSMIVNKEYVTTAVGNVAGAGVVGVCTMWAGTTPPARAVVLDGAQLSKEAYAKYYAIIGDNVALANDLTPDSASFYNIDARSRYFRGTDYGASRSDNAQQYKYYEDMLESHSHDVVIGGGWAADGNTNSRDEGLVGSGSTITKTTNPFGGIETMPMTVPLLPIVWVIDPMDEDVAQWWLEPEHQATKPVVHHINPKTDEYLSTSWARPSPLEPGVWLTPAFATQDAPPPARAGYVTVFRNGTWLHDAELWLARENAKKDAKESREKQNRLLMERDQRRQKMNEWLQQQGAPFTLNDLE